MMAQQTTTFAALAAKHDLLGPVKRCPKCKESWPRDGEFWYVRTKPRNGLSAWCRACTCEDKAARMRERRMAA